MSARTVRANWWIGVTQRSPSSTAAGSAGRIGGQRGPLLGVLGQGDDHAGEQVPGGLVAGDEQGHREGHQLAGGHRPTLDLRGHEGGHQVVAGSGGLRLGVGVEEGGQLRHGGDVLLGHVVHPVRGGDGGVGPAPEVLALTLRHPEELGDGQHGERSTEPVDDVDGLAGGQGGHQVDHQLPDAVLQGRHRPRREASVEDPAPLGVGRRVHVQDGAHDPPAVTQRVVDEDAVAVGEAVGAPTDLADVLVAADGAQAGGDRVHGRLGPEAGGQRVEVGPRAKARVTGVEGRDVHRSTHDGSAERTHPTNEVVEHRVVVEGHPGRLTGPFLEQADAGEDGGAA